MTEVSVDLHLPDLDQQDVFDALCRRAADIVIDNAVRHQRKCIEEAARARGETPTSGLGQGHYLAREIQRRVNERVTARIDEMIDQILVEKISDGTIADRVRARLDAVLDEPVDKHGRPVFGGTNKTRRIEHCLNTTVRAAIVRHVNDAARAAVALINAEAKDAFRDAADTIIQRMKRDG